MAGRAEPSATPVGSTEVVAATTAISICRPWSQAGIVNPQRLDSHTTRRSSFEPGLGTFLRRSACFQSREPFSATRLANAQFDGCEREVLARQPDLKPAVARVRG